MTMDYQRTISSKQLRRGLAIPGGRNAGRSAFTLIELLLALAIGAMLLAAVASVFAGTASVLKVNQANLMGLRSARVAMDMIMAQLRKADSCQIVGTAVGSGDATFPYQATELKIVFGGGAPRSDCAAGDKLDTHIQVISLSGGKTGLRIWKDTGAYGAYNEWNGQRYSPSISGTYDIPNIVSAAILYNGDPDFAKSVQLQIVFQSAEQQGRIALTTLTSSTTIRRE